MKPQTDLALSRRGLLGGALAAGASLMLGGGRAAQGQGQKPWNIVMLVSDEHNRKRMGCAGDPVVRTPNIDRLAAQGVRCTAAYASSPVCAPARVSLLTGLTPQQHGVYMNSHIFDARSHTFAEHFRKHGYTTAVIGKTHTNTTNVSYGFDYWMNRESVAFKAELEVHRRDTVPQPVPAAEQALWDGIADKRLRGAPIDLERTVFSDILLRSVASWLAQPRTKPFFLYASWLEPHPTWMLPRAWYNLYDPAKIPLPPWPADDLTDAPVPALVQKLSGWDRMSEAQHRLCLARYLAAVSYSDFVVGEILTRLDELGLTNNTLVVYLSDHGDMASEKRMWLKGLMYDASAGIPLVFRMPGQLRSGTSSDVLFGGTDLFPTLAGLVGAAADLPSNLAGRDLSAQVRGGGGGPEYLYSTLGSPTGFGYPPQLMVRNRQYKLIRYHGPRQLGKAEMRELYDLKADPWESTNLATKRELAPVVSTLVEASDTWFQGLGGCPYPIKSLKGAEAEAAAEDPNADTED